MNKILFCYILCIIVTTHMMAFPVQAKEDLIFGVQTAVEDLSNEESTENWDEETVSENDSKAALVNETVDESVSSEETEGEAGDVEEVDAGAGDVAEEAGEAGDAEEGEPAEEGDPADAIDGEAGDGDSADEEAEGGDAADGESGTGDAIDGEWNEMPGADPVVNENPENGGTTTPPRVYARPVINRISTDGKSVTLEWDNTEGAVFQVYRWNILPYVIGTTTEGSFVDTNVARGWSYTYFIATSSSAYRYPYSQTVSVRVRLPIEDIDEGHKLGDDLAWGPAEGEEGGNSLVISGSGSMPDFASPSETPWHDSADEITKISIDDGVTYVGDHTFSDMENLQEVSLPSSVREYGHEVFRGSTNLEYFDHESGVDGEQLRIAVQYLTGVYSGSTFEPEVNVRKGAGGEDFDGMPELIQGRDYTVTYNNTTDVGDGTIEITFIGDYADAGSVVIPFTVVSELRKDEKTKNITKIELRPASSTYTGFAQHPEIIVRSGHWILKEGVDYTLTYTDMVDVGTYTIVAEGIGAYRGRAQAVYTIRQQGQSEYPQPPVDPSNPGEGQGSGDGGTTPHETEKEPSGSNGGKSETGEEWTEEDVSESEEEVAEAITEPEKEEKTEAEKESEKSLAKVPTIFDSGSGGNTPGNAGFPLSDSVGGQNSGPVVFFVGAVGIVGAICMSVYFWFFHQLLHGM